MYISVEFGKTQTRNRFTSEVARQMPEIAAQIVKKTRAPGHFIAHGLDAEHVQALTAKAGHYLANYRVLPEKPKNPGPKGFSSSDLVT